MLKNFNRNLSYLFIINLAFGLSMQLINPLFPLFLSSTGANETEIAYIISAGSLAATLLMLPSGIIIDRVGKKIFLVLNGVFSAASIYMISNSTNWQIIMPFYVLYSLAGAFFVPARMAMISESATPENSASLFGLMNLAWPITGIISPVLSGWVVEKTGWNIVYLIAVVACAISVIPALLINEKAKDSEIKIKAPKLRDLLKKDYRRVLFVMSVAPFMMTTAIGAINLIIPLYLKDVYHLSPLTIGLFFTAANVITLLTQIPSGRLADRYDPKKIILICTSIVPIFFALWHFTDNWILLLIFYSLGFGLWSVTWPSNLTTLSTKIPRELQGAGFGINSTGVRFGFTIGPIIGSYLYTNHFPTAPFLASAFIVLLSLPVISLLESRTE